MAAMQVFMVRHKISGLFLRRRCCKIDWAAQCYASVCSTRASLQEIMGMIPHADIEHVEVKTYQLLDPDAKPDTAAEYNV